MVVRIRLRKRPDWPSFLTRMAVYLGLLWLIGASTWTNIFICWGAALVVDWFRSGLFETDL